MSKSFSYPNKGTCSKETHIVLNDDHTIESIEVIGGCKGNTQGLARMVIGCKADEVAQRLEGIPCRGNTSCPDQLSKAIHEYHE